MPLTSAQINGRRRAGDTVSARPVHDASHRRVEAEQASMSLSVLNRITHLGCRGRHVNRRLPPVSPWGLAMGRVRRGASDRVMLHGINSPWTSPCALAQCHWATRPRLLSQRPSIISEMASIAPLHRPCTTADRGSWGEPPDETVSWLARATRGINQLRLDA